jgi:hypothetical protein
MCFTYQFDLDLYPILRVQLEVCMHRAPFSSCARRIGHAMIFTNIIKKASQGYLYTENYPLSINLNVQLTHSEHFISAIYTVSLNLTRFRGATDLDLLRVP